MTTDNLIEELTRLEKEATPGPWMGDRCAAGEKIGSGPCKKCGASMDEGCRRYEGILEGRLATFRDHLPAILSALKENKRLREALEAIEGGAFPGAINAAISGQLAAALQQHARAALQPQGEK